MNETLNIEAYLRGKKELTRFEAIKLRNYLNSFINGELEEAPVSEEEE